MLWRPHFKQKLLFFQHRNNSCYCSDPSSFKPTSTAQIFTFTQFFKSKKKDDQLNGYKSDWSWFHNYKTLMLLMNMWRWRAVMPSCWCTWKKIIFSAVYISKTEVIIKQLLKSIPLHTQCSHFFLPLNLPLLCLDPAALLTKTLYAHFPVCKISTKYWHQETNLVLICSHECFLHLKKQNYFFFCFSIVTVCHVIMKVFCKHL